MILCRAYTYFALSTELHLECCGAENLRYKYIRCALQVIQSRVRSTLCRVPASAMATGATGKPITLNWHPVPTIQATPNPLLTEREFDRIK